jgi:hypothetical protein
MSLNECDGESRQNEVALKFFLSALTLPRSIAFFFLTAMSSPVTSATFRNVPLSTTFNNEAETSLLSLDWVFKSASSRFHP